MSKQTNHEISRRTFLGQTSLLAGGLALRASTAGAEGTGVPGQTSAALPRRTLGKTGVSITALTLGTAPSGFALPHSVKNVADCVRTAIDLGITGIDTAPAYDVAEEGVGIGLGSRRKEVFLSTKVMADRVEDAEKILAASLKKLKTDYVDLLYFHCIGDRKVDIAMNADGVFTWLVKQKKAGRTRFVGISGHHRPGRFARFLESGECDVLLTVVNFVDRYTYRFEEQVLPIARKHGVGIVAMKVFGGAKNGQYAKPQLGSQLDPQYLEMAVRYAMGVPGVATLNLGAANPEQIPKNVAMVLGSRPLVADEQARLDALGRELAPQWGKHFGPLVMDAAPRCGRV
ncbi:MAG: aldo/keto reductase [Thermoguttaceae bacterium]